MRTARPRTSLGQYAAEHAAAARDSASSSCRDVAVHASRKHGPTTHSVAQRMGPLSCQMRHHGYLAQWSERPPSSLAAVAHQRDAVRLRMDDAAQARHWSDPMAAWLKVLTKSVGRIHWLRIWRSGNASDSRSEGWEFKCLCVLFPRTQACFVPWQTLRLAQGLVPWIPDVVAPAQPGLFARQGGRCMSCARLQETMLFMSGCMQSSEIWTQYRR